MPLKLYLDKRQNKHKESPIRVVWSFNGDRYQTTMGFSIPPEAWDEKESRVTPAAYNHKNTPSSTINAFIVAMEKEEKVWRKMLSERYMTKERYFQHFRGGKYKLIGFGKDSDTLEDVVIYQALYRAGQIWVRPYNIFFGKATDENGNEVERFKEINRV